MKTGYIYKVTSPNNKIYIGQTINLKRRINSYKNLFFKKQIKLWNSCHAHNWNPLDTLEIIEELQCNDKRLLNEKEIYWINFYNSKNNGLNCTDGGDGTMGHKQTEETKKKIGDGNRYRIKSEEEKIKQVETRRKTDNYIHTKEQDEKNRLAHLNKIQSQETINKRIETTKFNGNYTHTKEHNKKIGRSNEGKVCSEETKEKLRQINLGKKYPNKKISEEGKLKMLEAQRKRRLRESTCIFTL